MTGAAALVAKASKSGRSQSQMKTGHTFTRDRPIQGFQGLNKCAMILNR
jgi:hypothetical protein